MTNEPGPNEPGPNEPGPNEPGPNEPGPIDVDDQLAAVERFIADVQSGAIGTSEAMIAYRDTHRPAIVRLRAELDAFEALLAPDLDPDT